MALRELVILDSAKRELVDIKLLVEKEFGPALWCTVSAEYRAAFTLIQERPEAGAQIEELAELGIVTVRCVLVRQTRVVYEFDQHRVLIHLFIHTRRDFRNHLFKRLLSS